MNWTSSSRDSEPFAYVRGVAIDLTVILIVVHVVCMLVGAVLMALGKGASAFENALIFSAPESLVKGRVWQLVTYPFYHNIAGEGIWFAVDMFMLGWFGRDVERFLGKLNFAFLYLALTVVPALLLTGMYAVWGRHFLIGSYFVHLSVFMAFVFIYPNAMFLFGILAKWFGLIMLSICSLMAAAKQDWVSLFLIWSSVFVAYLCLKIHSFSNWADRYHDWNVERQAKKMNRRRELMRHAEDDFHRSVDPILEKISREGIQSLTRAEREQLERARERMLREEKK